MNIIYLGGKQAGCIGLLTLLALKHYIVTVVPYDEYVYRVAMQFNIPLHGSIKNIPYGWLKQAELLVSVHGREIVPMDILKEIAHGGINLHPCLSNYKGADPIGRLLADGGTHASVGAHRMTEDLDNGELLLEEFVDVTGCVTREEIYNILYPYYTIVLNKAMRKICT